jgi:cold shock CspA family protein
MNRERGRIERWFGGYGFVNAGGGLPRLFLHMNDLPPGSHPAVGQVVSYVAVQASRGLRCASARIEDAEGR